MKELIKTSFKKMVVDPFFWVATMMPLISSVQIVVIETLDTLAWIPKGMGIGIKYAFVGVAVSVFFFFIFFSIEVARYKSTKLGGIK